MRLATENRMKSLSFILLTASVVLIALIVRLPFIYYISEDYLYAFGYWYNTIVDNGYYTALKYNFSNYTIYNYLLATTAVLFPYYKLLSIKAIAIISDFILAFFVYKCVRIKYQSKMAPLLAGLVTLLAPTVVLNSALWGQIDAMYTAFMIAGIYALLVNRQGWAFAALGLSFSIKPQALFLAPLFLWLLMKKEINLRYLSLSPLVFFITILPGWLIGRPFNELLFTNVGYYRSWSVLQRHFPNLYQWIPNSYYNWYLLFIVFTLIIISILTIIVRNSRIEMTKDTLIYLATLSVLIVPFFLPRMSDRYFFPADVIAIVLAFYLPKYWYVPVLMSLVSLGAYGGGGALIGYDISLFPLTILSLKQLAIIPLALIMCLVWQLLRRNPVTSTQRSAHNSQALDNL